MKAGVLIVCVFWMLALGGVTTAAAQPATPCDRLAASADTFDGFAVLMNAGLLSANFNGGVSYDRLDARQAIPACEAAVQRTPQIGRVWFQYGRALEKGNRLADAIVAYQKAADLGSADGLNNLAELYRDGKSFAKSPAVAERMFLKAARGGSWEAAISLVNILVARRTGADLDLALTISKLNIPTDVSIATSMSQRHGAAMARIPAAAARPTGPESYKADIVVEIAPNTPSGMYCVQSAGKPVCVPSDRLRIRANDVDVRNEPPPITALNGHEATVSPTTDIALALIDKPIAMVQYIDRVDAIFKDVIVANSPNAPVQGGEAPMRATLNALFRVDSNCWQGEGGRICVTPKTAMPAAASAPSGAVDGLPLDTGEYHPNCGNGSEADAIQFQGGMHGLAGAHEACDALSVRLDADGLYTVAETCEAFWQGQTVKRADTVRVKVLDRRSFLLRRPNEATATKFQWCNRL